MLMQPTDLCCLFSFCLLSGLEEEILSFRLASYLLTIPIYLSTDALLQYVSLSGFFNRYTGEGLSKDLVKIGFVESDGWIDVALLEGVGSMPSHMIEYR